MLNLFGRWIMTDGTEKEIAMCQLSMKLAKELSWFNRIKVLLNKYNLSPPPELFKKVYHPRKMEAAG